VDFETVLTLPAVEDLPILLENIRKMRRGDALFAARSFYQNDRLVVAFA
jgi:hypothetical protein